jgi:hypothetical protein
MSELQKATLVEITPGEKPSEVGTPVPVQFNPATMKLQISNSTEGGQSRGKQTRQFLGTSSTTLTVELVFDTADEGTTRQPRSVRERTAMVEKFVLPKSKEKTKQAPPKVRFHWGPFVLDGVIDSINIDIEHFAGDGTPLRAKVGLSIKEQNSKYQYKATDSGANQDSAQAGDSTAGLPGGGPAAATQSAAAIGGESAADFAARQGLDPSAWRGLDIGGSASLSLNAGQEVGFRADLSASAGLGVTAGFEAGVSASLDASVGLAASAGVGVSASAPFSAGVAAGFTLSSAGGVSAAIAQVQTATAVTAIQQTAQAFNQSLPAAGANPAVAASPAAIVAGAPRLRLGPPDQPRTPLSQTGIPSALQQAAAAPAPATPRADTRAASFGFGVPLRPQITGAATERADVTFGSVALKPQIKSGNPPITSNPVVPPWIALPAAEFLADAPRAVQMKTRPQPSCGCTGRCGCRGHSQEAK